MGLRLASVLHLAAPVRLVFGKESCRPIVLECLVVVQLSLQVYPGMKNCFYLELLVVQSWLEMLDLFSVI